MRPALAHLLGLLTACSPSGSDSLPQKERVVVLISLSGFPARALLDPAVQAPTLRRLASEGASAARMTGIDPAVSWPNHAALATGAGSRRHGVLYNGLLVREGPRAGVRVKPCPRGEVVRIPTFYDLAHEAGLTTAQIGWVPGQAGGTITWGFGEMPDPKGPIEQEMSQAGLLGEADFEEVGRTTSPKRDDVWFRTAVHVIARHRPGVLLVRLTDLDAIAHKYGPGAPESLRAITAADARLAGILEALAQAGLKDRLTLFVVSDQGFKTARRHIRPNAALRAAGLLVVEGPKLAATVASAEAQAVTGGGTAMVFITNPDRRKELTPRVKEILGSLEGVERIIDPTGYGAAGYPEVRENEQMGDLVLLARPGYSFIAAADGEPVTDVGVGTTIAFHGFPSSDPDMDGIFVAWGRGIRPGARLERIANVDVAPTAARVLGLTMETAEGRILRELLK
jgi:predicted AlkP superfamily pyrophosphatase or phosphodiesterase